MDYLCCFYGYPKYFDMLQAEWLNNFRKYYPSTKSGQPTDTPLIAEVKPFLIRSPIHQKAEFEEFIYRSNVSESYRQFATHELGKAIPFKSLMFKGLETAGFKKWEFDVNENTDINFRVSETNISFLARKVDKYYEPQIDL